MCGLRKVAVATAALLGGGFFLWPGLARAAEEATAPVNWEWAIPWILGFALALLFSVLIVLQGRLVDRQLEKLEDIEEAHGRVRGALYAASGGEKKPDEGWSRPATSRPY